MDRDIIKEGVRIHQHITLSQNDGGNGSARLAYLFKKQISFHELNVCFNVSNIHDTVCSRYDVVLVPYYVINV